ncbi:LAQU0S03e03444g1_1 [Lachancea quebecensis]|uniref:LAQU0S03e03444g1_1 n=1 Tax=Lachancea quebecensis TaxID=1654605 RepID=A0A0N7ML72_9SACH|nr:LAQU0S03e03444g1_1 [Lachancea quebecensis]
MLSKNSSLRRIKTEKKRHSMVLTPSSLDLSSLYGTKNSNKSMDALVPERSSTQRKSSGKSRMKRSTVLLDDNMVREYNLAIQELNNFGSGTGTALPRSDASTANSSVSTSTSMSSLFSRESSMSIHDLMYQDCVENETGSENVLEKGEVVTLNSNTASSWSNAVDDVPVECSQRTQLDFF